jgi:hypothetical protein
MSQGPKWSDDRQWWWDGRQWRPAGEFQATPGPGQPPPPVRSAFSGPMPWIAGAVVLVLVLSVIGIWVGSHILIGPVQPSPSPDNIQNVGPGQTVSNCPRGVPFIGHTPIYFEGDGNTGDNRSPLYCMDNGYYTFAWKAQARQGFPTDQGLVYCNFSVDLINPKADVYGDNYTFNIAQYNKDAPFPADNHKSGITVPPGEYYLHVTVTTMCESIWSVRFFHE